MSKTGCIISHEGVEYLCGLIRDINGLDTNLIDDINIKSNGSWSSVHTKNMIDQSLTDSKEYVDKLIGALNKLSSKKTTVQPTLNNSEFNVIYLYSSSGSAPFDQYLKIGTNDSDAELVSLGSTNIDLTDYLTITDAVATYCKKTDFDTLKTEATNLKTKVGTDTLNTTSQDLTGGVNELKTDLTSHTGDTNIHVTTAERTKWNKIDNKVDKTNIIDNLTSTNTDKPLSANQGKVLKGEVDKKANDNEVIKKTAITTTINSASTDTQVPGALTVYNAIYDLVGLDKNNNILTIKRPSDELEGGEIHLETPITGCTLMGDIVIDTYGDYLRIFEGKGTHRGCRINLSNMKRDVLSSVCTTSVADVPVTNIAPSDTTTFINFKGNSSCNYCVKNGICYVSLWGVKIAKTGGTIKSGVILPKSAHNIAGTLMIGAGDATEHAFAFIIGTGELCFDVKDANIPLHCSFSYPVKES